MADNQLICFFGHTLSVKEGFCRECAHCYICHNTLLPAEYFFCLREADRDSDPAAGVIQNPTFCHSHCFSTQEKAAMASENVTIPRSLFNKLNARLLVIEPLTIGGMKDTDVLAAKTQEQDAMIKANFFIHESAANRTADEHQEYLYTVLRRMEAFCAALSLTVSRSRRHIELNLDKKIAQQNADARAERSHHLNHKTPKTEKRTERKAETKEEKAISKIMGLLSCSEEDAKKILGRQAGGSPNA